MKNAHPQFPGHSASLAEIEETPEERERTLMPLNPQTELANCNTTLMSCATNATEYQYKKLPARTEGSIGSFIIRNIL